MSIPAVVVVGSRSFSDRSLLFRVCAMLCGRSSVWSDSPVWSGGARGADSLGVAWARFVGRRVRVFPARWSVFGKSAGFRRSAEMVAACPPGSVVLCFVDKALGSCRGSNFTVSLARKRGLRVLVVGPGDSMCHANWDQTVHDSLGLALAGCDPSAEGRLV